MKLHYFINIKKKQKLPEKNGRKQKEDDLGETRELRERIFFFI